MYKLIFLAALALLTGCSAPGFRYTLKGHIEGLTDSVMLVDCATNDTLAKLPVADGSFRYKGRYDEPTSVAVMQEEKQVGGFYIEPGNIRLEGRLNVAESSNKDGVEYFPSGTAANDARNAHLRFFYRALHAYNFGDHDEKYRAAVMDSLNKSAALNLVANTDNIFGVGQIATVRDRQNLSREQVDSIVRLFPPHLQRSRMMKIPLGEVERVFRSQNLADYTDFTANDADGKPVKLAQVVWDNQYVLVDFWFASCGPCRGESPHLKAARNAFRDKGFEIVGVSRDNDLAFWKEAIAEDGMTWINLVDNNNRVCDLYSVTSFPTNYLIDCQTGKIIARNLRGHALSETLEQLFKKP